jgi:hypothetical protein
MCSNDWREIPEIPAPFPAQTGISTLFGQNLRFSALKKINSLQNSLKQEI